MNSTLNDLDIPLPLLQHGVLRCTLHWRISWLTLILSTCSRFWKTIYISPPSMFCHKICQGRLLLSWFSIEKFTREKGVIISLTLSLLFPCIWSRCSLVQLALVNVLLSKHYGGKGPVWYLDKHKCCKS